jgi:hypothetical protein
VINQVDISKPWKIKYMKACLIIFSFFSLSLLILFAGWSGWLNNFCDKPEICFQRSGSLMTVVLLVTDYYVYKLLGDVNVIDMTPPESWAVKDFYRPYVKILLYIALFLTMLATFIWGYGDLVYLYLRQS